MISFSNARNKDGGELAESYARMSQMLLQAIGIHAVEAEAINYERFRAAVNDLQAKLAQEATPANILVVTGATVQALQHYNLHVSSCHRAQSAELQRMVGMLTQTMSEISAASAVSIAQLEELRKAIEAACATDDMRELRARLSDCLDSIRKEMRRQRAESSKTVANLDAHVAPLKSAKGGSAVEESDPVTGLGQRLSAEKAIQQACDDGSHAFAGMFLVDRIHAINTRFGIALGDKLVLFFLQHLSQGLSPRDQVFRWSKGSFVAVMERQESYEHIRRELARLLSRRLEQTFEMADRSVVIPVASTWAVFPLFGSGAGEVSRKLDAFLTTAQGQASG